MKYDVREGFLYKGKVIAKGTKGVELPESDYIVKEMVTAQRLVPAKAEAPKKDK